MANTFAAETPCSARMKITAKPTSNLMRDSLRASMAADPSSFMAEPDWTDDVLCIQQSEFIDNYCGMQDLL